MNPPRRDRYVVVKMSLCLRTVSVLAGGEFFYTPEVLELDHFQEPSLSC